MRWKDPFSLLHSRRHEPQSPIETKTSYVVTETSDVETGTSHIETKPLRESSPSPFLDLPRELRDAVYAELLPRGKYLKFNLKFLIFTSARDLHPVIHPKSIANIYLVSGQVYTESLRILLSKQYFPVFR